MTGVSGIVIGGVLAGVLALMWLIVVLQRRGSKSDQLVNDSVRTALTAFAEHSLELQSIEAIFGFVREAAEGIFRTRKVIVFERVAGEDGWEAIIPGDGGKELGSVPSPLRGVFGWVRHNPDIAAQGDLVGARFGAMRRPIQQLMDHYGFDVLLPLVERGKVRAVLGLMLGRTPAPDDRAAMRLFRLAATAACANVRLHREAAHLVSLDREVDLAKAINLALVPEQREGAAGPVSWAGFHRTYGRAGSDFWTVRPLSDGRVLFFIGDAVGAELAGAMVAAVVLNCAETVLASERKSVDPVALLTVFNRALYRGRHPALSSCFIGLLDPAARTLDYANAGHVIPYHLRLQASDKRLGALAGSGSLLGDSEKSKYTAARVSLTGSDAFVLFTNGLLRTRDRNKKNFSDRALQKVLEAESETSAVVLRDTILEAVEERVGVNPNVDDDQALLVVAVA